MGARPTGRRRDRGARGAAVDRADAGRSAAREIAPDPLPENTMKKSILIAALALAVLPTVLQAKECYAPDAARRSAPSRGPSSPRAADRMARRPDRSNAKADFEPGARGLRLARQTIKAVGGRGSRHGDDDGLHQRPPQRRPLHADPQGDLQGVLSGKRAHHRDALPGPACCSRSREWRHRGK